MQLITSDRPARADDAAFPSGYTLKQAASALGLTESQIRSWIQAGFVEPRRDDRGAYRFSFPDLVLLRSAKELTRTLSARKVKRALGRLRAQLPRGKALSALRIAAEGDEVVVQDGGAAWTPDTGQVLLDFEVAEITAEVAPLVREAARAAHAGDGELEAEDWYELGCDLEPVDAPEAREAYARCLEQEPDHPDAHVNLGRLCHEAGDLEEAEAHYRAALDARPGDATAVFDLAVVLEDRGDVHGARRLYYRVLERDPGYADAHYNLARIYEAAEKPRMAARHMKSYEKLVRSGEDG